MVAVCSLDAFPLPVPAANSTNDQKQTKEQLKPYLQNKIKAGHKVRKQMELAAKRIAS